MQDVSGYIVPKMYPVSYDANDRWFKYLIDLEFHINYDNMN